jgi:hypothetical protein
MIKGGKGGASTNITGLKFEQKIDVKTAFSQLKGYEVKGAEVFFEGEKIAELYKKNDLYKVLLKKHNIKWEEIVAKRLFPDEAIFVVRHNTIYIIEKKFQHRSGSVDEKLQTCDFKKKQYRKILAKANIRVEYGYVLNDWFKQKIYRDVLDYIRSVDCFYYFEELPFSFLGLPGPKTDY